METCQPLAPALYLLPSALSDAPVSAYVPPLNVEVARRLRRFVVEDVRTARRFLRRLDRGIDIDALDFVELNEHTPASEVPAMLEPVLAGQAVGVVSEAGCPAVADPGADLVAAAQARGVKVVPLVGPSSILLGLMASGFNGQSFAFLGYLPMERGQRAERLRQMEARIRRERQTQIFIETPYRTNRLVADLAASMPGDLLLCVAYDLTGHAESVVTRPLSWWKAHPPAYGKTPAIFLMFV